jgi:hypothetical protein
LEDEVDGPAVVGDVKVIADRTSIAVEGQGLPVESVRDE